MDEAKEEGGPIHEAPPTLPAITEMLDGTEILCLKNKMMLMIQYISVKYKITCEKYEILMAANYQCERAW